MLIPEDTQEEGIWSFEDFYLSQWYGKCQINDEFWYEKWIYVSQDWMWIMDLMMEYVPLWEFFGYR